MHVERPAKRFFWSVLALASIASIVGNGAHSWVRADLTVPREMAVAVAIAPPIVLMLSIEGLSLLAQTRRRSPVMFWATLAMTAFLAVGAFVLSFEALRDLAIHNGVPAHLGWLWPVIIDVTIAQATLALVQITRGDGQIGATVQVAEDQATAVDDEDDPENGGVPARGSYVEATDPAVAPGQHGQRVAEVLRSGRLRQAPEVVERVLELQNAGLKVTEIAAETALHHSTVRRIIGAAARVAAV